MEDLTSPLADAGELFLPLLLGIRSILSLPSTHSQWRFIPGENSRVINHQGSFGSHQRVEDLTSPLADAGKLFLPLLLGIRFQRFLPYTLPPTTSTPQSHLIFIPGENSSVINPTVLLARNEWKTSPVH